MSEFGIKDGAGPLPQSHGIHSQAHDIHHPERYAEAAPLPPPQSNVWNNPPALMMVTFRAVVVYDGAGNYFIHGCNDQNAQQMFEKMSALWKFDPSKENAHYVEFDLEVPALIK